MALGEITVEIYIHARNLLFVEHEVHHGIVGFSVGVVGIVLAYEEAPVLGGIVDVVSCCARGIDVEHVMVIWRMEFDGIHPHAGICHLHRFHAAVFIA